MVSVLVLHFLIQLIHACALYCRISFLRAGSRVHIYGDDIYIYIIYISSPYMSIEAQIIDICLNIYAHLCMCWINMSLSCQQNDSLWKCIHCYGVKLSLMPLPLYFIWVCVFWSSGRRKELYNFLKVYIMGIIMEVPTFLIVRRQPWFLLFNTNSSGRALYIIYIKVFNKWFFINSYWNTHWNMVIHFPFQEYKRIKC